MSSMSDFWNQTKNPKTILAVVVSLLVIGILLLLPYSTKRSILPEFLVGSQIDFNKEIRPILNKNCITCHGGVKQSGGFSLLFPEEWQAINESGKPAIVPGRPGKSEFIKRIKHHDTELRMPLEGDQLSEGEIRLLTKWIKQGAKWEDHWAYIPPKPVDVPDNPGEWTNNGIDYFVKKELTAHDLIPSKEADKATLIRRVSLDLIGLPPTMKETEVFLNDNSPDAYEKLVDGLLDSPKYGERWAGMWMDLARYADTKGYEADRARNIWKYRDWLIQAFNRDMPFDEFMLYQLAGDLLPDPSEEQFIATAFHRNTMTNDEGGTDNEEFRVAAVIDRINTTWSVLQGTTMECVQCHSHPYDPIRHEDFYKSMAFFNNTADADVMSETPKLAVFKEDEDLRKLEEIKSWLGRHIEEKDKQKYYLDLVRFYEPKIHPHSFDQIEGQVKIKGEITFSIKDGIYAKSEKVPFRGSDRMMMRYKVESDGILEIRLDSLEGELIGKSELKKNSKWITVTNKDKKEEQREILLNEVVSLPVNVVNGERNLVLVFKASDKDKPFCTIEWVLFHDSLPGEEEDGFMEKERNFLSLINKEEAVITTPVMLELPKEYQRKTYVFERGNWMVHGEEVRPGVPEAWNYMSQDLPPNREGLARWLFHEDNPLTARVMVNRLWEQLFGTGIVETLEDFGSQGFEPSHPELLDWLAIQFREAHQWSIKSQLKQMVMSSTYRQSSQVSPELVEMDPNNRLLARGPRVRLSAEQIRDQALAVSGLLSDKMLGPSVMPLQPDGIWQVVYNGEQWETSEGEDQYRRALYTFWRRTSPYPSLISFDSPSREFCTVRRIETNTPIQALVTLNDPVYLETARFLAEKMLQAGPDKITEQLKAGYKFAMLKEIDSQKLSVLEELYAQSREYFENKPEAIEELIGERDIELAILTVVANTIMNMDEFITKS